MCNQKGGMWLLGFSQEDHMGSHEQENASAKEQEHTSNQAATNIQRVLRGFLGREMTNTKKKAIKKLSEKFNLTYDEAINILSSQQSFLNYMETIDINGFPNFFKYLMNEDNIDIIEILLNIGLDVNNTVDTAGRSALHYVASAGANNLLNILIRY